ncbi:AraC family transcriptional regulator [Halopolyspora algeriensis]|uniref:AraC family transcriptional regulator n=1 Tax=Halopolyspora algeriensis TaxID=1500506 RepID=A0A368VS45_9ACTN|nr:AraC family transcriptional regulator [Halopolyspora algeriensis]RCW44505.1 AraC family transcriptional regulator [Halopolyspora algeriensis]TQM55865.1 AraC family transcriptional regulator [Halopolyspora algeriensis]
MSNWRMPRSITSAHLLTRLAGEYDVPPARCLHGTGIDEAALENPHAEIESVQELALIHNLVSELDEVPGLGVIAGDRYHLSTYGFWGFAVSSRSTLRSAVSFGMRYYQLTYAFCEMTTSEDSEELRYTVHDAHLPPEVRAFLVERDITAALRIHAEGLGLTFAPHSLGFRTPRPSDIRPHRQLLGTTPAFEQPDNHYGIPRRYLDQPLPQANSHTTALCEAQCEQLLRSRSLPADAASQVRTMLAGYHGPPPKLPDMAREFNVSTRTLRRKLAEHGVTYRDLVAQSRRRRAVELLAAGELTVAQVAAELGYTETATFVHAFKRWHGMSPRRFAAQHRR